MSIDAAERPSEMWVLEIQDAFAARRVPLGSSSLTVGSSKTADVVLEDSAISGRHCEIRQLIDGVGVRDLGSTSGTYVGGARLVDDVVATAGATISLGRSTITCLRHDESEDDEVGEPLPGIAGGSISMRRMAARVRRYAKLSEPVHIHGETGTGKECIARALHSEGPRAHRPFVPINMSALPRELFESELFGHERGAYTGAINRRAGAFAEADGGSLFLDEIAELLLDTQPKLLRALDGYELRRVGSSGGGRRPNARIITASNEDLSDKVQQGRFRSDLFHRIEAFNIELPPLRERRGDIPQIARALLVGLEKSFGPLDLTPAAVAKLAAYDWPGNVRELRKVLARAADFVRGGPVIDAVHVDRAIRKSFKSKIELTSEFARVCFDRHGGNLSAAARSLGVPRTTFRSFLNGSRKTARRRRTTA
ncbi:MAG: sigma 54-interacting transcriptional regulator [Polyangiaceae bacterium]|nr:sigma 54-interacting transcriptional regulator [Polyangiaceae bacterium]